MKMRIKLPWIRRKKIYSVLALCHQLNPPDDLYNAYQLYALHRQFGKVSTAEECQELENAIKVHIQVWSEVQSSVQQCCKDLNGAVRKRLVDLEKAKEKEAAANAAERKELEMAAAAKQKATKAALELAAAKAMSLATAAEFPIFSLQHTVGRILPQVGQRVVDLKIDTLDEATSHTICTVRYGPASRIIHYILYTYYIFLQFIYIVEYDL